MKNILWFIGVLVFAGLMYSAIWALFSSPEVSWAGRLLLVVCMLELSKSMMGFHFPWEKCPCCGDKMREHRASGGKKGQ